MSGRVVAACRIPSRNSVPRTCVFALALLAFGLFSWGQAAQAAIAYVQGAEKDPNSASVTSVTATFTAAQVAGHLNVVAIGWGSNTVNISSVTDTKGNVYTLALKTVGTSWTNTAAIYYAKNIVASAANGNAVTIVFASAVGYPDLRVAEYSGIDTTNPLDVTVGATGSGATTDSGTVITTNASDLLIGSNQTSTGSSGPGPGYTQRIITGFNGDILEDQIVNVTGAYSATAPMSPSGNWIMQMAAFRAAATGADTSAPSAPGTVTATGASGSQINVSWGAATDNVGVASYVIDRCQGASCSTFAQVNTTTTASFSDVGLSPSTSYSYRVRAVDAAGNVGVNSSPGTGLTLAASNGQVKYTYDNLGRLQATTFDNGKTVAYVLDAAGNRVQVQLSSDTTAPSVPAGLTATVISPSQINLNWNASTDNVGVTGYYIYRDGTKVGSAASTSFSDTGLSSFVLYNYTVSAHDISNNESAQSSPAVPARTADNIAPSAPGIPTFNNIASTSATANWAAASDNAGVTSYDISVNSGAWTSVGNVLSASVTGLPVGAVSTVSVRAHDAAGNVGPASSGSVTTNYITDSATIVIAQSGNFTGFNSAATGNPIGSMTPATTSNGYSYYQFGERVNQNTNADGGTTITISGFSADPGRSWLSSASCVGQGGITGSDSRVTYSYGAGQATWSGVIGYTFAGGAGLSPPCTIIHK